MSVRNIRNHQSRGLLPPPEVPRAHRLLRPRARRAPAPRSRRCRPRASSSARSSGCSAATARDRALRRPAPRDHRAVRDRGAGDPHARRARRALRPGRRRKVLAKAQKLGLLVPLGDGRFEAPSPALLRAAEEVVARGIPLPAALDVVEQVQRTASPTARAFVKLFLEELWKPFDEAGQPDERWPEITESIERLRPIASEALLAVFQQTMAARSRTRSARCSSARRSGAAEQARVEVRQPEDDPGLVPRRRRNRGRASRFPRVLTPLDHTRVHGCVLAGDRGTMPPCARAAGRSPARKAAPGRADGRFAGGRGSEEGQRPVDLGQCGACAGGRRPAESGA